MTVEPFLFSTDAGLLAATCEPSRGPGERVSAIVVDWESHGKARRQHHAADRIGTDTQIATDTADDLARVRSCVDTPVICRINAPGSHTENEVETAIRLGADEILVPMVRDVAHVEAVLRQVDDRAGVGVMVETVEASALAPRLGRLPISRAYVGLMDLALDRGTPSIFTALVDGTVEHIREHIRVPFGFGGLTIPGRGNPIPTLLLLGEMTRLECHFSFLRRSFIADTSVADAAPGVGAIRVAALEAERRSPSHVEEDRERLVDLVTRLDAHAPAGHPA